MIAVESMRVKSTAGLFALLLITLNVSFGAGKMPPISVTNTADARIEIIPIDDEAHLSAIPFSLANIPILPSGSFVLRNRTASGITVVVAEWLYIEKNGNTVKRGINCDGYVASPMWTVVKPQDLSLITLDGCTPRELLSGLASGQPGINGPIPPRESIARIELALDSVIFEDGQIWGPDKRQYYKKIWERYNAAQSVVSEVVAAKNAGKDMASQLIKIRNEARGAGDKISSWKEHFASMLQRSPNPEGTLKQLQEQIPPPEFRHIGDHNK